VSNFRLNRIAEKLKDLSDEGFVEESEIEELEDYLWNIGDLQEDTLVPMDGPGYRGPHNHNQTSRKPLKRTLLDTRPPRGVRR
jgi:hypothetical protein